MRACILEMACCKHSNFTKIRSERDVSHEMISSESDVQGNPLFRNRLTSYTDVESSLHCQTQTEKHIAQFIGLNSTRDGSDSQVNGMTKLLYWPAVKIVTFPAEMWFLSLEANPHEPLTPRTSLINWIPALCNPASNLQGIQGPESWGRPWPFQPHFLSTQNFGEKTLYRKGHCVRKKFPLQTKLSLVVWTKTWIRACIQRAWVRAKVDMDRENGVS